LDPLPHETEDAAADFRVLHGSAAIILQGPEVDHGIELDEVLVLGRELRI
jgi:hypothetical protein